MVGLDSVKKEVQNRISMIRIAQKAAELGSNRTFSTGTLHMVFTGNPGTGKTTVARLIGKIYGALGVLKKPDVFIECGRNDLVAGFIGQTAPLVKKKFDEAKNGEKIQGMFVSGYSKLKYWPTVLFFSDQALYAFWNSFPSWYLPASGDKKKYVIDCKCRYDAINRVSVIPTKLGEGLSGFGMSKVSCSLLNSTNLFEFSFDSHYIQEDKLAEMVVLLAANGRRK